MPGIKAPLSEVAATGVHGYAVASNAVLALFRTGDLAPETAAHNMPGTGKEHPDWQRRLRAPLPSLLELAPAHAFSSDLDVDVNSIDREHFRY
jgi:4-alpha-glucanotransferase